MKNLAESFNTAAPNSNPGSRSREYEVLPLSHCVPHSQGNKWGDMKDETQRHTSNPTGKGKKQEKKTPTSKNERNKLVT